MGINEATESECSEGSAPFLPLPPQAGHRAHLLLSGRHTLWV